MLPDQGCAISPPAVCTLIILVRPGHSWPLVFAANRDERLDRTWDPPAAWWPERPGVIAGRDHGAGGTWMGVNRYGVVAAVLNRQGSLGPAPGKRTRGKLPLIALGAKSAREAAQTLAARDAGQWRSFNLVVGDATGAVFLRGLGQGRLQPQPLRPGLHMVTAHDPDDWESPRVARHLPRFAAAERPDPPRWGSWPALLADRGGAPAEQLNVVPRGGFGTVCASLLAIPAVGPISWLFAAGPPHTAPFVSVRIEQ